MPSGGVHKIAHLEYESDVYAYQGAQFSFIGFDELTHFTEKQFFYLYTRNRSAAGIPGAIRATCNPDPDSWVKEFIRWWLDDEGRYADPEKSGKIRWFIRLGGEMIWADSKEELIEKYGEKDGKHATSVTFIPSKLSDNKILTKNNPQYEARIRAADPVERARLLEGDWLIKPSVGS